MTSNEVMVSIMCALVGYWVISALIGSKKPPGADAQDAPDNTPPFGQQTASKPAQAAPVPQAWHAVLAVSRNANLEEVQTAYRTLISQYHPDKVASLDAELQALAETKTKAINQAYNEALAEVGSRHT